MKTDDQIKIEIKQAESQIKRFEKFLFYRDEDVKRNAIQRIKYWQKRVETLNGFLGD
jgi:hypothetical protein